MWTARVEFDSPPCPTQGRTWLREWVSSPRIGCHERIGCPIGALHAPETGREQLIGYWQRDECTCVIAVQAGWGFRTVEQAGRRLDRKERASASVPLEDGL